MSSVFLLKKTELWYCVSSDPLLVDLELGGDGVDDEKVLRETHLFKQ